MFTKEQIVDAFNRWKELVIENPEMFDSVEDFGDTYGDACYNVLTKLIEKGEIK